MMTNTDQELEIIYRDTFPQVAKVLHGLGADLITARDLFHDAMILYLEKKKAHTLPAHVPHRQYIVGIARILWFKQCKQESQRLDIRHLEEHPADPASQDNSPEKKFQLLHDYLKAAGETCMRLLQAFYYEKLSMSAIAEKFHYRSTRSATVQKYKCLEKLREKIKHSEIYEEAIA